MKRILNKFKIVHKSGKPLKVGDESFNQIYIEKYVDAIDWLETFCKTWKCNIEDFTITPVASYSIDAVQNYSAHENQVLKAHKVFSGAGLKFKTQETKQDNKYKFGQPSHKDIKFAESALYFKGTSVIFSETKKKRKQANPNDHDTFLKLETLSNNGELRLPDMTIETDMKQLLQSGLSKVDVYRKFKGKAGISNNKLHDLISRL